MTGDRPAVPVRRLSGHRALTQAQWFRRLATAAGDTPLDEYGRGAEVQAFEAEIARLLGKPAAVFLPKGVIAQQAALRTWTDRSRVASVALHPLCHLEVDEDHAVERLHRLTLLRIGKPRKPFGVEDLEALHEPLGAVTVELPLRRAGFLLPDWDELCAISAWTRGHGVPLHFDGARLWESRPYYGRTLNEIAALADSIYVSFYKGLGGLGGCVLAGSDEFIAAVRPWLSRHGAWPYSIAPYLVAAREGLRHHLPRMDAYVARAHRLAEALATHGALRIWPQPPHTNGFQVWLPAPRPELEIAAARLLEPHRAQLFPRLTDGPLPGWSYGEIQIGEAAEDWRDEEVVDTIDHLLTEACR